VSRRSVVFVHCDGLVCESKCVEQEMEHGWVRVIVENDRGTDETKDLCPQCWGICKLALYVPANRADLYRQYEDGLKRRKENL